MRFLPARIMMVPNHGPYSLSTETEAEPRQIKITYGFTEIRPFTSTEGLTCHQQHCAAYTALGGKGNSNNNLKILVPLWSEMVCWNRTSMQPHLNIAVAGMA